MNEDRPDNVVTAFRMGTIPTETDEEIYADNVRSISRSYVDNVLSFPIADSGGLIEELDELDSREDKAEWSERYDIIVRQAPSVTHLDWNSLFRSDPTILGNIINDILKRRLAPEGRPGKRPAIDRAEALEILNGYQREDYSLKPFSEAFSDLKGSRSVRAVARKVSMSPTYTHGLLTGHKDPTVEDMRLIAQGFNREPSYFYEYRVAFVCAALSERMGWAPESSIIYYERIVDAMRKN